MQEKRIKTKPLEILQQLRLVIGGITEEPNWPTTNAPDPSQATDLADSMEAKLQEIGQLEAQLMQARRARNTILKDGRGIIKRVDQITDGLYGPYSGKKLAFGLPQRRKRQLSSDAIPHPVITRVVDGVDPGDIHLNWRPLPNVRAYAVEWYLDSALTQLVGHDAPTQSNYTIKELQPGVQYWMRVRGAHSRRPAQWSGPVTHIASL